MSLWNLGYITYILVLRIWENACAQMKLSAVHDTLRGWVEDLATRGKSIQFTHGFDGPDDTLIVSAVAMGMTADPLRQANNNRHPPPRRPLARARYVLAVSDQAGQAEAEHVLLELLSRTQSTPGFSVVSELPSPTLWLAYGVKPRPAFIFEAGLTEQVTLADAPVVREHQLGLSPMTSLRGRVVASDGTPLAFAQVQIVSSGRLLRCDVKGEFRIDTNDPGQKGERGWVRVQAHGTEERFRIPGAGTDKTPWLLQMKQL